MATIASATARSVVAVLCVPVLAEVNAKDKVWSYLDEIQEDRDGRVLTESSSRLAFFPSNTAECYDVPGINTALSIIYDPGCPGLGCFEEYPCRYAAPASCDCECHGDRYAPDDRNDPPNDCWIPGFGYDLPCCPTPVPTTGTCADSDDGAADDDGDDCAGYTANPGWCSYHDDADFTSSDMCCACGGGEYQAVLLEQPSGDQKAQRNLRGTAPTPATASAPPAVPDGYTMHAGMGSGPGYTADGGWIRISVMEGTTVLQCADACDQLPSCAGFTMLLDSNTCNLKSVVALTIPTDGINKDTYVKEAPTL